jgi:hypothetical protein
MNFAKSFNKLSWIVKLLLTIFLDPIVGGLYRISKGRILVGLLWLLVGFFGIGWIIDIVTMVLSGKYTFLV